MTEAETFTVRVTSRVDHLEWHYGKPPARGSQLPELLAGRVIQVAKHRAGDSLKLVLTPGTVDELNKRNPDQLPYVTGGWLPESLIVTDDPIFPYTPERVQL